MVGRRRSAGDSRISLSDSRCSAGSHRFSDSDREINAFDDCERNAEVNRNPVSAAYCRQPQSSGRAPFSPSNCASARPPRWTRGHYGTTLTNSDVIRARRLEPPGNVSWQITVRRYSDSDVTVARTHLGRPFALTRALSHEERWDAHHLPVPSVEAPACRGTTWGVLGMTPWSNMLLS